MKVPVIRIGNSRGIRLSKTILERYNIRDTVEMILEKGHIIIKSSPVKRSGWEEAFRDINARNDDQLLIDDVFEDENPDDWKYVSTISSWSTWTIPPAVK
jgi:antitoxin MazE